MDMPRALVRHPSRFEQAIGGTRIEFGLVVARNTAAEQLLSVCDRHRRGINRADDDASGADIWIDHDGAKRMRELGRLAATLDIAPMCRSRPLRHMDRDDA